MPVLKKIEIFGPGNELLYTTTVPTPQSQSSVLHKPQTAQAGTTQGTPPRTIQRTAPKTVHSKPNILKIHHGEEEIQPALYPSYTPPRSAPKVSKPSSPPKAAKNKENLPMKKKETENAEYGSTRAVLYLPHSPPKIARSTENQLIKKKTETENAEYGSTKVLQESLDPLDNNVMNTGAVFGE